MSFTPNLKRKAVRELWKKHAKLVFYAHEYGGHGWYCQPSKGDLHSYFSDLGIQISDNTLKGWIQSWRGKCDVYGDSGLRLGMERQIKEARKAKQT